MRVNTTGEVCFYSVFFTVNNTENEIKCFIFECKSSRTVGVDSLRANVR